LKDKEIIERISIQAGDITDIKVDATLFLSYPISRNH